MIVTYTYSFKSIETDFIICILHYLFMCNYQYVVFTYINKYTSHRADVCNVPLIFKP